MKSVSQNIIYYLAGSVVQKVLVFFYLVVLARFLGPDLMGKYSFALSFVAIFTVLMDFGLNQVLIRESAKNKEETKNFFNYILTIKALFSFLVFFIIVLTIRFLNYPLITRQLVYLVAIAFILDNFTNTIYSVLRGCQNLKYEGIGLGLYQFIVLLSGLIFLYFKSSLPYFAIPLILGSFVNLGFAVLMLFRVDRLKPSFKFSKKNFLFLLKLALPFFLVGILGTIYSYIDVVLLSKLASDRSVGFYSAGGRIPAGLRILPIAFSAALYPAASFYFKENKERLKGLIERAIFYLMILTIPIVIGLWVLADSAIIILYGKQFVESIPVLRVLSLGISFVFLDYIFLTTLNACGRERINMINRALAMAVIIVLNLIFIPPLRHLGSALAFILSFVFLSFLGGLACWREIKFSLSGVLGKFLKILLASLVMGGVVFLLKKNVPIIFLVLIGVIIYLLMLFILRLLRREELQYFKGLINSLKVFR